MLIRSLITAVFLLFSISAHAVFEVRAHYGFQNYSPDSMNDSWADDGHLERLDTVGADLIYSFMGGRLPIGVRYLSGEEDVSSGDDSRAIEFTRVEALLGYRLILGASGYVGILASVPVSGKTEHSEKVPPDSFSAESETFAGGSIGVEAAFRMLDNFTVGLEVGQSFVKAEDFKNGGDDVVYDGGEMEVDYAGTYVRLVLGMMF